MIWSVCESRLSRSHTACEPQQSSAISTGGCSGVTLLMRRTKIVAPMMRIIRIVMSMISAIFLCVFFERYTMRVCIDGGRVRVACRLLYPIFKFGWCCEVDTH